MTLFRRRRPRAVPRVDAMLTRRQRTRKLSVAEHYARLVNQRKLAAAADLKWEAAENLAQRPICKPA
jgi:hypothetical protein